MREMVVKLAHMVLSFKTILFSRCVFYFVAVVVRMFRLGNN